MEDLRDRIIRAHGGRQRWDAVERLMACLSMGGATFLGHMQPRPLREVEVAVTPAQNRVSIAPFQQPDRLGVYDGRRVWLEDDDGAVIAEREDPGLIARSPRHWLVWDDLDLLYVAALTAWEALLLPWLLGRDGVAARPAGELWTADGRLQRLEVFFPADVPTVSRRQTVYADRTGLVRRLDLSPVAYGGWMRVAHAAERHDVVDGLVLATRHALYPCLMNTQLWRAVRLVWLDIEDVTVAFGNRRAAHRGRQQADG